MVVPGRQRINPSGPCDRSRSLRSFSRAVTTYSSASSPELSRTEKTKCREDVAGAQDVVYMGVKLKPPASV